jgi:hypothetical protein
MFIFICIFLILLFIFYSNIEKDNFNNNNNEENDCFYVSSRGILKSCNIKENNPISSFTDINNLDLNNIKYGDIIYVCADSIDNFINKTNSINTSFILVSGDGDLTVSDELIENYKDFINSSKLIKWYSQNCTATHLKIFKIPIGLDYHSYQDHITNYISPVDHEKKIIEIIKDSQPFYNRINKIYANFHFRLEYPNNDRKDAYQNVNKDLVYYTPQRTERFKTYSDQTIYAFVLSPHGNGLDCHRTWESLILGSIPIVKKSQLDELYVDLPVLIVNEWSDLTQELLDETIITFKNKKFNYNKLTLKYWTEKIKN